MTKRLLPVLLLAACSDPPTTDPSPTPPPTWGVPISGGTMHISNDGRFAIAADPDRDRLVTVDIARGEVIMEIPLEANDEPGRLIEDNAGRVHVALRRGGAVIAINPETGEITSRRPTCAEPRGLAFDVASDSIHVACGTGELVTLPAASGDATRVLRLDRDLRDVLVINNKTFVTTFKKAEILELDSAGAIVRRTVSPTTKRLDFNSFDPTTNTNEVAARPGIAWRSIALKDNSILMLHQRQVDKELGTSDVVVGGYGGDGGCGSDGGPVESAVTQQGMNGAPRAVAPAFFGSLPVDVAVNKNGDKLAFVLAGAQTVREIRAGFLPGEDHDQCPRDFDQHDARPRIQDSLGAPTSVGYTPDDQIAIFYPEVPAIAFHGQPGTKPRIVVLPGGFGYDSGRNLFHQQTPVGISCASCHPEGREDGFVWKFDFGTRRTQTVAGGVLSRAPFHWVGDMNDLPKLMNDVFAVRMAGGQPSNSEKLSLGPWLDRIPAPKSAPALDPAAAERGRVLFESEALQCVSCHNGAQLTNNTRVNVGTAGIFKVPSLVGIGARFPFMHTGCAPTLTERFSAANCGGGELHGKTASLDPAQLGDLIAYLETL